jgi:hypothetical protein
VTVWAEATVPARLVVTVLVATEAQSKNGWRTLCWLAIVSASIIHACMNNGSSYCGSATPVERHCFLCFLFSI